MNGLDGSARAVEPGSWPSTDRTDRRKTRARPQSRPSRARTCQNPGVNNAPEQDVVFAETQIGKGLKPLAQHGTVIVGADGTLTLLDSNDRVIDSAPLTDVTAKRLIITGGQTVSLTIQGRKYVVTPGWGAVGPTDIFGVSSAAKALMMLVSPVGK